MLRIEIKSLLAPYLKLNLLHRVQQNVTTFPVLIDINNDDNLLLIGMNTDVVIEILNEQVSMSIPSMSLRTRKDIYSAANIVNI